jgi:PPP family 3-phenylpropionic acid transporter
MKEKSTGCPDAGEPVNRDPFPLRLFLIYFLFYAGQSIYSTYLNLFLAGEGLSASRIGLIVSVSTCFILAAQLFWGMASDRARSKNSVLLLLYGASAAAALFFYLGGGFWFLLAAVSLLSLFFYPIMPLQDNIMLESFENGRWDYGQIRTGGTIGYCVTVLGIGFILQDRYRMIFLLISGILILCLAAAWGLRRIGGGRGELHRTPYRDALKNKTLLGMIAFNMAFSMGLNFFYNFYPIYFTSIGGTSSLIGTMMFVCALSEIPVLLVINRLVGRFGPGKILAAAGVVSALRWGLLFMLKNPFLIIAVNLLHGFGYTSFSYCTITYINRSVPRDLRATSQSANAMIGTIASRVIFGYAGGLIAEHLGTNYLILLAGLIIAAATVIFLLWSRTPAVRKSLSAN